MGVAGWTGLHKLISINNETCTVDTNAARDFRSTSVKPYYSDGNNDDEIEPVAPIDSQPQPDGDDNVDDGGERTEDTIVVATGPRDPNLIDALLHDTDVPHHTFLSAKEEADRPFAQQPRDKDIITTPGKPFELSDQAEVQGPMDRGVFQVVSLDRIERPDCIFDSLMVNELGYMILLANKVVDSDDGQFTVRGNVIHFSTTKSKRAACSVLAPEVYGMVAGVDMAYTISTTIAIITSRLSTPAIPTIACTDSYSLYECLVNLGTTQEQRLMIDIMALRQSYARRKLCEVRWIHGNDNPADGFTKSSPNRGFERIVSRNEPKIRMEGWVTRA
ncbi:hypothetical protein CSUB01_11933 [Colletotrichum sublineola]|uniref:Uncharacterized protein n=1 Tax=Colletotrichum sublineola TaxID=1173701 RepID=A0A066XGZ7_COLSU|nr:hypothetical protein CSUB01_11933 [Colletotrichum sublineola]